MFIVSKEEKLAANIELERQKLELLQVDKQAAVLFKQSQ